jgi:hypothetical protein
MQTGGSYVNIKVLGRRNLNLSPFSIPVITTNVVVGLKISKWQIAPVDRFHNQHFKFNFQFGF